MHKWFTALLVVRRLPFALALDICIRLLPQTNCDSMHAAERCCAGADGCSEVCTVKQRTREVGARHGRAHKIGILEPRIGQIGALQVALSKVGCSRVDPLHRRPCELRADHSRKVEVRVGEANVKKAVEDRSRQVAPLQARVDESYRSEVRALEARVIELDIFHVHAGHPRADERVVVHQRVRNRRAPYVGVVERRSLGVVQHRQLGGAKVGPLKVGAGDDGAVESRLLELGSKHLRPREVGALENRLLQQRVGQVRVAHVGFLQVGLAEVDPSQARALKGGADRGHLEQVGAVEHCTSEVDAVQLGMA
mmetsp:Transcript_5661/g.13113  ORF Transcript_5661/g.13113 Transcript_5661/m.13113 type:complete len:309 (+) Transcript_5661:180-1106(+)